MANVYRRDEFHTDCNKCAGTGFPLRIPGDPDSGHDLTETCSACDGSGRVTAIVTYGNFARPSS
jgi:DnaJ-class molecular chaperone